MRNRIFWTLSICIITIAALSANGLSLNSVGSRPFGMGGTGVSLNDDVSAIHWNPSGLAGQGTKVALGITDIMLPGSYEYKEELSLYGYGEGDKHKDDINVDAEAKDNHYLNPGLFFNYGMENMSFGFGAYGIAGIGAEWDGSDFKDLSGPVTDTLVTNLFGGKEFKWKSELGVMNISPTFAYRINEKISVGLAGCVYWGTMTMDRPMDNTDNLLHADPDDHDRVPYMDSQYSDDLEGTGYGFSLGVTLTPMENFNVGLTYKSPVKVKFEGDGSIETVSTMTDGNGNPLVNQKIDADVEREIEWPMWVGLGTSYKVTEDILFAFDVQYTQWSEIDTLETTITMNGVEQTEKTPMEWEDCFQIRLGTEYTVNEMFKARLGYYYDPAPAPEETASILFPSATYNAVTGGMSFAMNNFTADFGIEYLFGEERKIDASGHNNPGTQSFDIFSYTLGLGYNF